MIICRAPFVLEIVGACRRLSTAHVDSKVVQRLQVNSLNTEQREVKPPVSNGRTLVQTHSKERFRLNPQFIESFKALRPPFGFNGLGELVYLRTYSRMKSDGANEKWLDTVLRVVEGAFEIQQIHTHSMGLQWDSAKSQKQAQDMFARIFHMKFLPPGRGLWVMGTPVIRKKGLSAALNNCAFVSTKDLASNKIQPFLFLMDLSMLGVGVGFDTAGNGSFIIQGQNTAKVEVKVVIEDTRESWVESVGVLLKSFFDHGPPICFHYHKIRKAGSPLKTFGGIASGPEPLLKLHQQLCILIQRNVGKPISIYTIVGIMNLIGKCIVSGNVRRTAEIAFGLPEDNDFIDLKNYDKFPERKEYGWASNNTVFATLGMDYSKVCERLQVNGEPGLAWLDNMRKFSRMDNIAGDNRDYRVSGGNPCLEQSLESMELCCLVETFPNHHESLEDFKATLASAFLYAKTVTLMPIHWPESNMIMLRNRRIGCSISGVAQFLTRHGINKLKTWLEEGYKEISSIDRELSERFCIRSSIKMTSVKPSGTISLLAGATPGMHYPESRFYIRRVRLSRHSPLIEPLQKMGYHLEPCQQSPDETLIVEIPIDVGPGIRSLAEVSMWEQLSLAAFLQRYWADNQVSATITFDPTKTTTSELTAALNYFQYQLKGVSFLPRLKHGAFPQMPYEEITEEKYKEMMSTINSNLSISTLLPSTSRSWDAEPQVGCDGDRCTITQ